MQHATHVHPLGMWRATRHFRLCASLAAISCCRCSPPPTSPAAVPPTAAPRPSAQSRRSAIIKVGEAQMFVTETGLNTMMGEAAKSIQESSGHTMGLLESKIVLSGRVLIFLTLIAVACLLVYEVGFHGKKLADVLEGCLCLVIASVPVALPMVMKVTLSVGAKELASHGAIVTHLTALEDIASMKMLCSDKTGTLTTAQMTVYETKAKTWNGYTSRQVMEFAAIASNAANKDDAIDRAVYQAYAAMLNTSNVDDAAQKLALKFRTDKYAGFNPIIKRTVADVTDLKTGKKLRVAKGIVSKILNTGADGGIEWTVDAFETIEPQVKDADAAFGKQGYKTIAIAVGEGDGPMQYAGTLPIMDPPRADTKTTIAAIRGEGVGVKMITGDHVNIARELARQIDLGDGIEPNTKLWPASKARDDMILHTDGFAQVLPKDKHEVVAVLQSEHGMIVGMTGDGVNDAPALAKAQVGIAVEGATDAAQSAADIILTRPGLSPIHVAIQASRRIFKRLKAYVIYRICCTVQVVFFLCFISFVYDDTFEPLYIILLALFHDLTIVTIAYDRQTPSPRPETPTVTALVITSYTCGIVLALSSLMLYIHGAKFLDADKFTTDFKYKESLMFLQITNSSALLIFSARATGLWFLSCPDIKLFISVVISQAIVNFAMLYPEYALNIVDEVDTADIMTVWIWNFSWLFAVDLAKIFILYAQEAFIQSKIPGRSRSGGWWADFIPFLLGNVKTEAPTPKEVSVSAKYGRGAMAETSMSHGIRHRLDSVSKTNKYKGVAKFGTSAAQTVAALGANNRMPTDESYGES